MRQPHQRRRAAAAGLALLLAGLTLGPAAYAAPGAAAPGRQRLRAGPALAAPSTVTAPHAATSAAARTDPTVLTRPGTDLVPVVVKLDEDPLATYAGDALGNGATSPSLTGRRLDLRAPEVRAQQARLGRAELRFRQALSSVAPTARVGRSFRAVYGGVAVQLPADRVAALAALPGVVAVQADTLAQPTAVGDEAAFVGAPALYRALGSGRTAGAGILIADVDSGVWPEHPSFAARPDLPPARLRPDGTALACDYGDDPLTPAADPYACSNKLVGGADFLQTYAQLNGDEPFPGTARDGDGHGTHTTSTAGGNPLAAAVLFGVDRGPVQGIAPGAQLAQYRACGPAGCYGSDTTAAVDQAVLDGADVLTYSLSGGTTPLQDPTELAFLDAYAAGVFVTTSAGNSGPAAGTVQHLAPWVTTVAASTQSRAFVSTVTLTAGSATLSVQGASIMPGIAPAPVVVAGSVPGLDPLCLTPAQPASLEGRVVLCRRGVNSRVEKGFNVLRGGAVAMLLENPTVADTETDNHALPTVHLDAPQAAQVDAFVAAHPDALAAFTTGVRDYGHGDVMAAFSARGPAGTVLKPDLTAPGVQVLAGNTPAPAGAFAVPGTLFQAIAGTSMSTPIVAGGAALLRAEHPAWTPGQLRSALATTADRGVRDGDGRTRADPFDDGSGRVDLTRAGDPGLTFDPSARQFLRYAADPAGQVDLNLPSVYAPDVPGLLTTHRTATNVTPAPATFEVTTDAPAGVTITVTPARFTLAPGAAVRLQVTLDASHATPDAWRFGRIDLRDAAAAGHRLHLPVALRRSSAPTAVAVTTSCAATAVAPGAETTCSVDATDTALLAAPVRLRTTAANATVTAVQPPAVLRRGAAVAEATLQPRSPGSPRLADGYSPYGYNDLAAFGYVARPIGDEQAQTYGVPPYVFHGDTYTSVVVTSDGYLTAGGQVAISPVPQQLPDPAAPNDVLAPFWADLDGTGDAGIRTGTVTDGTNSYLVVQADEHLRDTGTAVTYQVWIGLNGVEDVSFAYDGDQPIRPPAGTPFVVGAENGDGSGGDTYPGLPAGDVVVHSLPGTPGTPLHYEVTVRADRRLTGRVVRVSTELRSPMVAGVGVSADTFRIVRRGR